MTTDTVSALVDISLPNVDAFEWAETTGSRWVLYRSTPGDTRPMLAMFKFDSGEWVEMGPVTAPERFGPLGTTKAEFAAWCRAFRGTCRE